MCGKVHKDKDWEELGRQVEDEQTRVFLKLVFQLWEGLEKYNKRSLINDPPTRESPLAGPPSGLGGAENSMSRKTRASRLLMLALLLTLPLAAHVSLGQQRAIPSSTGQSVPGQSDPGQFGQSISEQKKAVVFIFGTIHPLNPDKSAMTDIQGNHVAVNVPLGTGFFVGYPDRRLEAGHNFCYLVTAKHVLQDVDGTILASVTVRLNLKSPTGDSEVGFIRDIPVTDAQGNLLWFHSEDQAEDVVALPLFPDEHEFEFTTISTGMFLSDQAVSSGAVAEGDDLYFIGLMEQYYGVRRNYPLVRRGTLALLTDESIDTPSGRQKVFIADLASWPGNSGSPVFLRGGIAGRSFVEENRFTFLGMIVACFLNKFIVPLNGGQPGPQLEGGDKANIGVTSIVPATVIQKVLDSLPAQQERDARTLILHGTLHGAVRR